MMENKKIIDEILNTTNSFFKVEVVIIESVENHPNADRLENI